MASAPAADEQQAAPHRASGPRDVSLADRLWAVLLTGLPFCVFKIGGGMAAAEDVHPWAGWALVAWGAADGLVNLAALLWPRQVSYCLLSNVGRYVDGRLARDEGRGASEGRAPVQGPERPAGRRAEALLLAVDTLFAFAIVATMIWFGRITTLPKSLLLVWELSVIANILGVGIERVWRSWRGR